MPQTLHLCRFQFKDVDIRRVGQTVDGGTSLSGISDTIEADGGGYWRADYTNGTTRTREDGLAWRQVTDLGLTTPVTVAFAHETLFAAPRSALHVPAPAFVLTDGTTYAANGNYKAAAAALRATTITISQSPYATPIQAGILFAIQHSLWGWRTYRLQTLATDGTATIRPPLRQAITADTPLDFDQPRCLMRLAQQPSNPTTIGRYGQCAASFVEHMRPLA